LAVTAARQLAYGSANAVIWNVHMPTASGRIVALQASVPGVLVIRTGVRGVPSGACHWTWTPMRSCPSRNATARTGTGSLTTALAG
jgi:hypothetical protein